MVVGGEINMKYIIKENLKDSIRNNKVVFFIGSGFSSCFKFPNWECMVISIIKKLTSDYPKLESLISTIENEIFSPIEVLEKLKDHDDVVYDYIKENFIIDEDRKTLLNNHKKIWDITGKVITTNYDKALEEVNPNVQKIVYNYKYEIAKLRNNDSYLLKLHGSIEDISNCIIFNEDYKRLYNETNNKCAIFQLQKIIAENTIVFLGFSLKDPYVCDIFESLNTIYNRHMNQHYVITTLEDDFRKYGTELIKLHKWDELPLLLDELITYKKTNEPLVSEISVDKIKSNSSITTPLNLIPKVALLIADPIDQNSELNQSELIQYFSKIEIILDFYYLSIDTLRELENYDYIIIFCRTVKNKQYIENESLSSLPITLNELISNLDINSLKSMYLFTNSNIDINNLEIEIPLVIINDDKKIKDTIFNIFRRADKKFIETNCQLINIMLNELKAFKSGKAIFTSCKADIPEQIDIKNLKGFVGRCNDLEDIIRKILHLKVNGQILNIKGAGGLGKTIISKKAVFELSKRGYFKDGIYFIDCEHIDSCKLLEIKISYCFQIDNSINFYEHIKQNNLKKDSIIILDNFETLLYLQDKEDIKSLVKFISDYSTIVLTSREIVFSEKYFEIVHDLRAFSTDEAVQLFIQNYPYVSMEEQTILRKEILEDLLNNNPLAIKIITNNLPRGKSIVFLKEELEKDFFKTISEDCRDIYNDGPNGNIEKSKSLYQSINYSYKRLQEKEKLAFELLSLFPDGIDIQDFKKFFEAGIKKFKLSVITDRELKLLEYKSLVEINFNNVKLQSIIRKFATSRFKDRNKVEKKNFYKQAFEYNNYLINICRNIQQRSVQHSLRLFDSFSNNILETLYYLNELDAKDEIKVIYLNEVQTYFMSIGRGKEFIKKFNEFELQFRKEDKNKTEINILMSITKLWGEYMDGDFEFAFKRLQDLISLEEIKELDPENDLHSSIAACAMNIYSHEGYIREYASFVEKFFPTSPNFNKNHIYFQLGEFSKIKKAYNQDFFNFESDLISNKLNIEELDKYIKDIHFKDRIELMQCNFIKAKLGLLNEKDIDKLVITNPYTRGLKLLMYALLEKDTQKKFKLFKQSINNLEHIKYYYVNAIYYFSKFLKDVSNIEYKQWFSLGYDTAKNYDFKYMIHLFLSLNINDSSEYVEEKTEIINNILDIDFESIS